MSMAQAQGATYVFEGIGTVVLGAVTASELAAGAAVVGGAFLVTGATGAALGEPKPVSRELGEQLHHAEVKERERLTSVAREKGQTGPVTLPTPSPFLNEAYVKTLPTQSALDAGTRFPAQAQHPQPIPGTAPSHDRGEHTHGMPGQREQTAHGQGIPAAHGGHDHDPGFAGHERQLDDNLSEARKYPYVNTYDLKTEAGAQARSFLNNCNNDPTEERKSFDSLKTLLKNVDPTQPGWDPHHLVEQSQTEQFGTEAIQNPNNIINIDRAVHQAITHEYNSAPELGSAADRFARANPGTHFSRVRDYVKTLSYSEQRQEGLHAIQNALENPRVQIPQADRERMEKDLVRLRNAGLEGPSRDSPGGCPEPPPARLESIIKRLSEIDAARGPKLTAAEMTAAQAIELAERQKQRHTNLTGPLEAALGVRVPPSITIHENGAQREADVLQPISGRVVGLEGRYMMIEKANGERVGLDFVQILAASRDPGATHAMAQAAFQNGNPVQVAMVNNQDLSVTPVKTQQLDQHRGMSRFDDYRVR